jgi:hypothetical protein
MGFVIDPRFKKPPIFLQYTVPTWLALISLVSGAGGASSAAAADSTVWSLWRL